MNYNAVIFDFDGTVADTGKGVKNSVKYALNVHGIPVGDETLLDRFIGPPLYESFEKLYNVSPEKADELVDTYRIYYAKKGVYELTPYPGMIELLSALKSAGIKTAVASSKPKHFLDVAVPHIGADKYFDYIIGPELKNHNSDKSSLITSALSVLCEDAGKHIAMVGDRFYDIEGAKAVGVTSVGVTFGYGEREELSLSGADFIVSNTDELKALLL